MNDSISISEYIGPSVFQSVCHTVTISYHCEYQLLEVEKNLVIMQSLHHHEDASFFRLSLRKEIEITTDNYVVNYVLKF